MRSIRTWWLVVAFLSGMVLAMGVEDLILSSHDNRLEFSTPVHFLDGQPMARLRNAAEVPFDIQTKLWSGNRNNLVRQAESRFVISFDLWQQDYAVVALQTPRKSKAHLTAAAAGPDDTRYQRPVRFGADLDAARHPRRGAGSRRRHLRTR
jgi:hypothetical protein